ERQEFPRTADVDFLVVDFAAPRLAVVHEGTGVATRVVVVDRADVDAEVAKGLLEAAGEVHLEVAAREARPGADVRVPVADVEAAGVRVIEAALERRLAEGLVDSAEPVLAEQAHVAGEGVGRGRSSGRSGLRDGESRRGEGRRHGKSEK